MTETKAATQSHDLIIRLQQRHGEQVVITEAAALAYYAHDVAAAGKPLLAVLIPTSVDQALQLIKPLGQAGIAMIARGGGLSYTDAYLADRPGCVLIDTADLNRILDINREDRFVVAECGVTWSQLFEALEPLGLRTPYFGPLSGLEATLGGALSQGSVFLGSGLHGSVGDSVLSIDVATAEGKVLTTGAAAAPNTVPFFRYFGPDLTGLFVGDAGSLGIKLRVSLRLIEVPRHCDYLSWQFTTAEVMFQAMAELARAGLASECFGFDPLLAEMRMKRASMAEDAGTMAKVVKRQGLLSGARLALRGRRFLNARCYSIHAVIEAASKAALVEQVKRARTLVVGGEEIPGSIPRALRAAPFAPPNTMLGPAGERWLPVHGIVPHSQAVTCFEALKTLQAEEADCLHKHGIRIGFLYATVAAQATLIEPVFYWPDSHTIYHRRRVEESHRQAIGEPEANPAARTEVFRLRQRAADILRGHGAVHFQLGKFYSYRRGRNPASLALADAIKHQLDPQGLFNPGSLVD
ncbi:MAG: FAD-binding oxidoreductase [Wenzhouxiangella sp.]|nr:FAD-binding oxidoreductase [Wenzhouxiangella sp.]MCH8479063.1 FAD-binding oxidoreductase [Wenzhouxiangella sp.]